jgi:hypothetical protein
VIHLPKPHLWKGFTKWTWVDRWGRRGTSCPYVPLCIVCFVRYMMSVVTICVKMRAFWDIAPYSLGVDCSKTTQRYIPGGSHVHTCCHENLKSYILCYLTGTVFQKTFTPTAIAVRVHSPLLVQSSWLLTGLLCAPWSAQESKHIIGICMFIGI